MSGNLTALREECRETSGKCRGILHRGEWSPRGKPMGDFSIKKFMWQIPGDYCD